MRPPLLLMTCAVLLLGGCAQAGPETTEPLVLALSSEPCLAPTAQVLRRS